MVLRYRVSFYKTIEILSKDYIKHLQIFLCCLCLMCGRRNCMLHVVKCLACSELDVACSKRRAASSKLCVNCVLLTACCM